MEGRALPRTIVFGLAKVPVRVISVVDSTDKPKFKRLHAKRKDGTDCLTPTQQPTFCPACNMNISRDNVVSGYDVGGGKFVVLTDEEKASVSPDRDRTITIGKFVPDDSYGLQRTLRVGTDKSYWLVPESDDYALDYAVLFDSMVQQCVIGIVKGSLWGKEWAMALAPVEGALALTQLHPATAVRVPKLDLPLTTEGETPPKLMSMAAILIDGLKGTLEEADLRTDSGIQMQKLLDAKRKKTKFTPDLVPSYMPEMDIQAALAESVRLMQSGKKGKKKSASKAKVG